MFAMPFSQVLSQWMSSFNFFLDISKFGRFFFPVKILTPQGPSYFLHGPNQKISLPRRKTRCFYPTTMGVLNAKVRALRKLTPKVATLKMSRFTVYLWPGWSDPLKPGVWNIPLYMPDHSPFYVRVNHTQFGRLKLTPKSATPSKNGCFIVSRSIKKLPKFTFFLVAENIKSMNS
jgi:hypothetical protein